MTDLFARTGLEQETGSLKERWGQDGSTPVDHSSTKSTDSNMHTVTAGKVLYLKNLLVVTRSGGVGDDGEFHIRDGGVAGTTKYGQKMGDVSGVATSIFFDVPLKFETDVYFEETTSVNVNITWSGWEEAA